MVQLDKLVFRVQSKVTLISSTAEHKRAAVFLFFFFLKPFHSTPCDLYHVWNWVSEHMTLPQTETSVEGERNF